MALSRCFGTLLNRQSSRDAEAIHAQPASNGRADRLDVCAICLDPIDHLSLVTVCVHGATSHAVHHACGQAWYTKSNKCASCGQVGEKRCTKLAYCLRLIVSITVNKDTIKDTEAMDALKIIGRTLLGIYKSKNVQISPTLELGYSYDRLPNNTAEIRMSINHPTFGRIHVPAELEDDKWYLSQEQGELVLVIKDGLSTYATRLNALPRRPNKFLPVTEMLAGVFFPSLVNPNIVFVNNICTQLKNDPFSAVELHGKCYDLQFPIFEMQRVSQTQHIYMNEGLWDLVRDADIKFYLDGLARGPFTLLFHDGAVRSVSLF